MTTSPVFETQSSLATVLGPWGIGSHRTPSCVHCSPSIVQSRVCLACTRAPVGADRIV